MKPGIVLSLILVSSAALGVELPLASPNVRLTQTIGLTDVTVEYSSPAVRGRSIWGRLVPYDEIWRAGANAATKITFSKDVTINKTVVPAGSYAFFVIPRKSGTWTLILNRDASQSGTAHYDPRRNLVSFEATPVNIALRERLTYLFADFSEDAGSLDLEWEKVRVSLPIAFNTRAQIADSLAELDRRGWEVFNEVAVYELEQRKDYDAALKWVDKSLKQDEDWFNVWTKAQILAAKGNYRDATAWARRAQQLGTKWPGFRNHADDVKRAVDQWKQKI